MSHINYNHLYYFWHVYKEGSVVGAAEALFLTPQTITGQIKALEERLQGKLFKRKGRGLEPSELGELVFRYADRMFTLSQEMLDIVNYRKESNLLFDVGVADALSKRLVSGVLDAAVVESEQIHLRCFESTHELLLEQLSQHKLDMIISDCPIDSTQQEGLFSVEILGEFDDAALMKAFGAAHNAIFVAPTLYAHDFYHDESIVEIGRMDSVMEEYHAIFAERMIQHPAVQRICNRDYSSLFTEPR
ncbi:transcriptional activator NhaR [Klebsiella pneumoniae]|nr:transcriptional activator NhaR [Klebsiella pneumoniae]